MPETFMLELSHEELKALERLIGHHTTGMKFDPLYERICGLLGKDITVDTEPFPSARHWSGEDRAIIKWE